MTKHIKHFMLILLTFVFSLPLWAAPYDGDYISSYKVDIVVNRDNTYDITENITYNFKYSSHGIYRTIPTRAYDGRKVVISGFESSENIANVKKALNSTTYVLGKSNRTLQGAHNYTLSYKYDVGEDKNKGFDAFYFNIIGTEWNVPIVKADFSITFKDPQSENIANNFIEFYKGKYKEDSNKNTVRYSINGNTITGTAVNVLPHEGVTILLSLSDGYFQNARRPFPIEAIVLTIFITFLISSFITTLVQFIKLPRSRFLTPVVSAYPPSGLSPLDVRYLYNKKVDTASVSATLLNAAENGFIKMEFNDKKGVFKKEELILHKVKDFDDTLTREEAIILNAIFKDSSDVNLNESPLSSATITTVRNTISLFYKSGDKALYVKKSAERLHKTVALIVIETIIAFALGVCSLLNVFGVSAGSFRTITAIIFGITVVIEIILASKTKRRTEFYSSTLEHILGLKDFIETVEKEKLEALIDEDPSYFYRTLSYAIALDSEKKWAKKFESSMQIEQPEWLYGNFSTFDALVFLHFSRCFNNYTALAMASSINAPTIHKGGGGLSMGPGGSIGGGFSGGGFGGGGGGSW